MKINLLKEKMITTNDKFKTKGSLMKNFTQFNNIHDIANIYWLLKMTNQRYIATNSFPTSHFLI